MSAATETQPNSFPEPQYFVPPPGGDVLLRSSDHIEFQTHSVLLSMVSPVFANMFSVANKNDSIDMSEDAETISWFLAFLYPTNDPKTISSFDMLDKCLRFAQKYDVERMQHVLETELCSSSPESLMLQDPFRVFNFAREFSLRRVKEATLRQVTPSVRSFHDPTCLLKLAAENPESASIIALIEIQSARLKILGDILFEYSRKPLRQPGHYWTEIRCNSCSASKGSSHIAGIDAVDSDIFPWELVPPPSWAIGWSRLVFDTLMNSPLEKCDWLFNAEALAQLWLDPGVCNECLAYIYGDQTNQMDFESWARVIRDTLHEKLADLEPLYAL